MEGFLNVLKPMNMTSHDVVLRIRRITGEEKIGHLGTLDPLAMGVLPLALGSYRRLSQYFLKEDKDYLAEFAFGMATDTGDLGGTVISSDGAHDLTGKDILLEMPGYTGWITQVPSRFSALKYKGKKMYQLARKGVDISPAPRKIHVKEFRLLHFTPGVYPKALFRLSVGSGTYVRSLAEDMGKSLGVGAVVTYLLRTRAGRFTLSRSQGLDSLKRLGSGGGLSDTMTDPSCLLPDMPRIYLKGDSLDKVKNGIFLTRDDFANENFGIEADREFLAVHKKNQTFTRIIAVLYHNKDGVTRYKKVLI